MIEKLRRFGLLAVIALPMAGCATAHDAPADFAPPLPSPIAAPPPALPPTPAAYDEILPELPADAAPGDCYAKVVVPGQPIAQPPPIQSAMWVMRPGPPGMPGPVWCLVPLAPAPQPARATLSREGWIRVLCDADATPERIGRIQRSLHERGYYEGAYTGRYDRETAQAVTRFQASAHIPHGGYLSLETVHALDAPYAGAAVHADAHAYAGGGAYAGARAYAGAAGHGGGSGYPPAYAPPPIVPYGFQSGYRSGYAPGPAYTYGPPQPWPEAYATYPNQAYGPPLPASAYPCCAGGNYPPGYNVPYGPDYGGYGYGGNDSPAVRNGWLVWSGKTTF